MDTSRLPIKKFVALVVVLLLAWLAYWLSGWSYIAFSVTSDQANAKGEVTYRLASQQSDNIQEFSQADNTTVKRMVRKGAYSVFVSQDATSSFTTARTKGLFTTTNVEVILKGEHKRTYVGNNPSPCAGILGQGLLSFECDGYFSDVRWHAPATATTPPYAMKKPHSIYAKNEGIINTNDGTYILAKTAESTDLEAEEGHDESAHFLLGSDTNFNPRKRVDLPDLEAGETYKILPHKGGFIVYGSTYTKALYYATVDSKPATIQLPQSTLKSANIQKAFDIRDREPLLLFSVSAKKRGTSEVVVGQLGKERRYTLNKAYIDAKFCGTDLVCATDGTTMDVYQLEGKKATYLESVKGVSTIKKHGDVFLMAWNRRVIAFDDFRRGGYSHYSLGDYALSDLQPDRNGYVAIAVNTKGQKVALFIEPSQPNGDSIDAKIAKLEQLKDIESVSIQQKYIFITPKLSPQRYNAQSRMYENDPAEVKSVKAKIDSEISKLAIDRAAYTITIIAP